MKILNIDTDCTDNGTGLRTVIYISGCNHCCEGCHNPSSWNPNKGLDYSIDELIDIIEDNPLANVTISGGDSLTYQYRDTLELVKVIKSKTGKNIWLYTGFTFEQILNSKKEVLAYIDALVDGKFILEQRDLTLKFRGSRNQRIIDVQKSLNKNKLIILD